MTTAPDRLFAETRGKMADALLCCPALTPAERQIALIMLLRYANREEFDRRSELICWPSEQRLAFLSSLTSRAVRKARAGLREKGIISVSAPGGHGRRSTTTYRFSDQWAQTVEDDVKRRFDAVGGDAHHPLPRGNKRSPLNKPKGEQAVPPRGNRESPIRGNGRSPDSLESESKRESKTRARDFFDSDSGKKSDAPTVGDSLADDREAERNSTQPAKPEMMQFGEVIDRVIKLFPETGRREAIHQVCNLDQNKGELLHRRDLSDSDFSTIIMFGSH